MKTINVAKQSALVLGLLLASFTTGCSTAHFPWVYRIDVDQGNIIDPRQLEQVTTGMTPRQVQYLMGTPTLRDPFNKDRWDYFYSYETGKGFITRRGVTMLFKEDKLVKIEKHDYLPAKRKF